MEIKAIIFDVGGVLALNTIPLIPYKGHLHHKGIHQEISKKLKISIDQWFDSIDTSYAESIEGKISKQKLINIISKNTRTSKKKIVKTIIRAYKKHFKQNKQLFKQAFKLQKRGYKIAILSDQWHLSKQALMPEKLYKNFNKVVVSCDVGFRKPNLKIYKLVLKRLLRWHL